MSYGWWGGFWPTSFPLFQASRFVMDSIPDSLVVDRSLIFFQDWERQLSVKMLYAYNRP